jgi:hypothetical protein
MHMCVQVKIAAEPGPAFLAAVRSSAEQALLGQGRHDAALRVSAGHMLWSRTAQCSPTACTCTITQQQPGER